MQAEQRSCPENIQLHVITDVPWVAAAEAAVAVAATALAGFAAAAVPVAAALSPPRDLQDSVSRTFPRAGMTGDPGDVRQRAAGYCRGWRDGRA